MGDPVNTSVYSGAGCAAINLSNDTTYPDAKGRYPRAIRVTGAGVVKVDSLQEDIGVLIPVGDYGELIQQVKRIYSTANGTTATGLAVQF